MRRAPFLIPTAPVCHLSPPRPPAHHLLHSLPTFKPAIQCISPIAYVNYKIAVMHPDEVRLRDDAAVQGSESSSSPVPRCGYYSALKYQCRKFFPACTEVYPGEISLKKVCRSSCEFAKIWKSQQYVPSNFPTVMSNHRGQFAWLHIHCSLDVYYFMIFYSLTSF